MITGNEPANPIVNSDGFPSYAENLNSGKPECIGLTIRQQFAMTAMQGLCANYLRENVTGWNVKTYAVEAVELADALIAELNRTEADNGTNGN
jgi:hypothetical protein